MTNSINRGIRLAVTVCGVALLVRTISGQPQGMELASTPNFNSPAQAQRRIVVISDLHFGLGCDSEGRCAPTEDFRWTGALKGFLDEVSRRGEDKTDLVIAGDFLELWKPPPTIKCMGASNDLGCTIQEMEQIVSIVISAHTGDFANLRGFSQRGDNRLYIVPGNHDAALLIPSVWSLVAKTLQSGSGRVEIVSSGVWNSGDKRILIEHGHQIGSDVNRYKDWPTILANDAKGRTFLIRPWGEQFVQRLVNQEEAIYPIIDNFSPWTAGLKHFFEDHGIGEWIGDIARFTRFYLFENSFSQETQSLGPEGKRNWDPKAARALGYKLFTGALDKSDKLRQLLVAQTRWAKQVQGELDQMAQSLPASDINLLCEKLAELHASPACDEAQAGALLGSFIPKRHVMQEHLETRMRQFPDTKVFIYGHTHKVERAWSVTVFENKEVRVLNSGAFQRLIEDDDYLDLVKKLGVSPGEGLRKIRLEQLAPCYSAVEVVYGSSGPQPHTLIWRMTEKDGPGELNPKPADCRPSLEDR